MDYDISIIGAGWAGFNAAIKAAQEGAKVCLIERGLVGGTCLNRGCIPTKALIQSAKVYSLSKKANNFGIEIKESKAIFSRIQERKEKIIEQLHQGILFRLKGIDMLNGEAAFFSGDCVKVGDKEIRARSILITTGSKPTLLKDIPFDGKKVISSDEILTLKEIPASLLIIGGGVIGCEFASLFSGLGTSVTVAEKMPQLLPGMETDVARKLEASFKKKGIKVHTGIDATSLKLDDYGFVLVAVGRIPCTDNLGAEKINLAIERGRIKTDDFLSTNVPGIYAAGDCTGKILLAHYAAYQGEIAAYNCIHPQARIKADENIVPSCIFTDPEVACVGLSEAQAREKGFSVKISKFDFMASGMARIKDETEGFLKIISDTASDELLGASIIGPSATELISVLTLALQNNLTATCVRNTIFAHPTLSEAIHEALRS